MKRLISVAMLVAASILLITGCAAVTVVDESKMDLPVTKKAMDQVHARIAAAKDGNLYVGAAEVDITTKYATEGGIWLGGFDMGRKNQGVRDPVYAHALYMDDGVEPYVLVTIDTIGYMNNEIEQVRALASDLHRDKIVVAAIHSHVGPDTMGYWGDAGGGFLPLKSGLTPEYMIMLRHLIAQAIDKAAESAKPAKLKFNTVTVDPSLTLNIHNNIRNQKDDVARIMTAEGLDGKPIAVVANWGCHVESMWNDKQLSADWAGVFYNRIRNDLGAVPLFVEGALGGLVTINPGDAKMATEKEIMAVFLKHMSQQERVDLTNHIGNSFADAIIPAVKASTMTIGPKNVSLKSVNRGFYIRVKNFVFEYFGNREIFTRPMKYRDGVPLMHSDMTILRIKNGADIVADFTSWPGEPAPTVVADLDAGTPAAFKFTVALGNDELGYMVRDADWDNVEYGYERTMSLGRHAVPEIEGYVKELRARLDK